MENNRLFHRLNHYILKDLNYNLCEDDKYEQDKFQQYNQHLIENLSNDQQETDYETNSNPDEHQENADEMNISSTTSRKSKDSKLWPLTTVNNPPLCATDEEEQDFNHLQQQQQSKEKKK